jgi:hypothetical protein
LRADSRNRVRGGQRQHSPSVGLPLARNVGIAELGVSVKPTDNSRLSMFAQGRAGGGQREVGRSVELEAWRSDSHRIERDDVERPRSNAGFFLAMPS